VKFERESLKKVVFTGDMKKYEDLSDVLEFIELTSETHFLIEGNKIIVY
jgi:transmembrane sensor